MSNDFKTSSEYANHMYFLNSCKSHPAVLCVQKQSKQQNSN